MIEKYSKVIVLTMRIVVAWRSAIRLIWSI